MTKISSMNDFVIRFANVNGTGSWSANLLFAKSIYRMGVPISPKNIFPSNIQGLPTFYEVRVNGDGHLGVRGDIDIMVAMNPESMENDIKSVNSGGYLIYDSTKYLPPHFIREDIEYIGLPLTRICIREYEDPKLRLLFKNIIYVGALAALLDIDFEIMKGLVSEQFKGKEKLIKPNIHALELGYNFVKENLEYPISITVKPLDKTKDTILVDGNTALALGAIYGGASVVGWYPITPSTSVIDNFKKYCKKLRVDKKTGKNKFAIIQAEDELAAIGIVLGANWNGARAFTATSGAGISLMSEFLGLAYFAEIPAVLFNIQRGGPSTGMPTRTQQSDIISCAHASHGDTRHILLFPKDPAECFDMAAISFDIADRMQTPVIVMSDLDIGMNDHMIDKFKWDDSKKYDRGKVLTADDLEKMQEPFGRYLDVDGDGIGYRTYPATHADKGSYFIRGSSHNSMAQYSEKSADYVESLDRLAKKWQTAKKYVPKPEITIKDKNSKYGAIFYGSSTASSLEAIEMLTAENININSMRIRAFPFTDEVLDFIKQHEKIFVIEQNRDAQLRNLLINELNITPNKLIPNLSYDGEPIKAKRIFDGVYSNLNTSDEREVA